VVGVILDSELAPNDLGHPLACPNVGAKAVLLGAKQEQLFKLLGLLLGEPTSGARMPYCPQTGFSALYVRRVPDAGCLPGDV
jgi:hypothetical protein